MSAPPGPPRASEAAPAGCDPAPPEAATEQQAPLIDSADLLGDRREVLIRHQAQVYRLRHTASGKLILTK